ncbi:NAD(+)/NADH kinase [Pendulispora rubella]|uniref:NAD(+)/NADH kinase n=1 Tax=Pendulispora rubella TaxID=2741070 RepID=A0ABZ2L5U6_9BACT
MRAALLYNSAAGGATSEVELVSALERIGWTVPFRVSEEHLDPNLSEHADVVIVAGGDGTVATVAKRLARTELPMAIVPMGTVNNVARSLGLDLEPMAAIAGLAAAAKRRIDLGVLRTGSRESYFVEGFSAGFLGHVLGNKASDRHKKASRAFTLIADALETYPAHRYAVEADGRDLSGDYVLVAVMNARSLGPALALAAEAKLDDGRLDLVRIRRDEKGAIIEALRRAEKEEDLELPAFETSRVQRVRIHGLGHWAHLDDEPWELDDAVDIVTAAGAVHWLAPRQGVPNRT